MHNYSKYKKDVEEDVASVLSDLQCQPILFVGSGFSRRYAAGPDWKELLNTLASKCPVSEKGVDYYRQVQGLSWEEIGGRLAGDYAEWAWEEEGRKIFPNDLYSENFSPSIFLKFKIREELEKLNFLKNKKLKSEIEAFKMIGPHAVITTNYDQLIEKIFPDYEVVVGYRLFRYSAVTVGDIFKIHGCISDIESMIFTDSDYSDFDKNKNYISAKLLTYFAEHPLLFIGYSIQDKNLKNVLHDLSRMYVNDGGFIPNIYILSWSDSVNEDKYEVREDYVNVADGINLRVKVIVANDFEWVYKSFGVKGPLDRVDLKGLRSILHRTVNLVRRDYVNKEVDIDFSLIQESLNSKEGFASIFRVAGFDSNSKDVNIEYPYTSVTLTEKLGLTHFNHLIKYLNKIYEEKGIDLRSSDNKYHIEIKTGKAKNSRSRKYSVLSERLLRKVIDGEEYDVDL